MQTGAGLGTTHMQSRCSSYHQGLCDQHGPRAHLQLNQHDCAEAGWVASPPCDGDVRRAAIQVPQRMRVVDVVQLHTFCACGWRPPGWGAHGHMHATPATAGSRCRSWTAAHAAGPSGTEQSTALSGTRSAPIPAACTTVLSSSMTRGSILLTSGTSLPGSLGGCGSTAAWSSGMSRVNPTVRASWVMSTTVVNCCCL